MDCLYRRRRSCPFTGGHQGFIIAEPVYKIFAGKKIQKRQPGNRPEEECDRDTHFRTFARTPSLSATTVPLLPGASIPTLGL